MIPISRARALAGLGALAASALVLSGCTSDTPEASTTPVSGGTLVYASGDAEPECLDPHVGGNYPQALVSSQFLEPLVSLDGKGGITPWLADSWTWSDDGLGLTLELREGVSFTDGTPFDAEAVIANIRHVQDPATLSSTGYLALQAITEATAVDASTVQLTLSTPDSALLESLSQPWLAMESPAGIARGTDANCAQPIGTGPFSVERWDRQQSISLVRNDDYSSPPADAAHEGPAYLERIDWRFLPDAASRYAALQSGEVDVIDNAQPDAIASASSADTLRELDAPRPGASNRIELNSGQAPFDDERVREAFIRSADVDPGIAALFQGSAERSHSPLASTEPAAVSDPDLFAIDADRAAELLDAAGWSTKDADGIRTKDGQRLTLRFPVSTNQSIPAEQSLFEQIQATTKAVGFDVQLEPMDLGTWYEALGDDEYELVSAPYTKAGPDVLRILYDTSGITPAPSGYFANHAKVSVPAIDQALAEARSTTDLERRTELYADVQERVMAGYWILPLYDQQNHFLSGTAVQGLRALPSVATPTLYDTWLAR
ncbi:peptide/nickel transport system substrate-binding protein [Clavibacter sp. B3I6]|uniref:ABC transporter substrate-binding protein n=1 Tax=Clavibacter sp. B3I6 TaxID=3042268 RepID=UPI0027832682|nr:ABC transporter substrate-binding protein [Clavibacter sp. B3I6]MDQ0743288.1 peptide/nickel transport system substrate-binding protein [Clavibacter sp. B3I6]